MIIRKSIRRPISGEEEHLLLEFARFLSGTRSSASVAAYQSDIRLFAEGTAGLDLFRVSVAQETEYVSQLESLGFKSRTIARNGTALRFFREFMSNVALKNQGLERAIASGPVIDDGLVLKLRVFDETNDIDGALFLFLQSIAKSRSQATLRAYSADLQKLQKWMRNTTSWQLVTKQQIADFMDQQIASGLKANSAARLLSTIRSFFLWLKQNDYVVANPTLGLQAARGEQRAVVPSINDLKPMTSRTSPSDFPHLRDFLVFELLYRCGLRVSEISSLNLSSIDLKRRRLNVQGRRSRLRYISLPECLVPVLTAYLRDLQSFGGDKSDPLIVNLRGGRLTVRSIGRIVEGFAASNELPEGTHPFTLRHAYALHGIKAGKDLQEIRHGLGVSGVSAALKIGN